MTSRAHRVQIFAKTLLPISLIALAPAVEGQSARAPIVALPQHGTGGTDDLYYLDLGDGAVTGLDQLRRDPTSARERRLDQNLFRVIGRPSDQPAAFDEILLGPIRTTGSNVRAALFVETSTGYVAFFDQLGRGGSFGEISTAIGRPFAALASPDGNYALLMRHDSNGRTIGAYLYHAGSGQGLYVSGLDRLPIDARAAAADGFPRLAGQVAGAELQSSERTVGYLVADAADGSLRIIEIDSDPRMTVRDLPVGLFPTFAGEVPTPTLARFAAAPVRDGGETTTHVLFVDTANGDLAVVAGVEDSERTPTVVRIAGNLYAALGTSAGAGARVVAAVEGRAGNGATRGVWLIDSLTRGLAFVDGPATPASATVRRVALSR